MAGGKIMWANIGKSIILTFVISICSAILSFLVAPLLDKFLSAGITGSLVILLASLGAYVAGAKLLLNNQSSWLLDLLSVITVPVLVGFPIETLGFPPYGPTLTLYNAYLSPMENIARQFSSPILNNSSVLVLEVLLPPLLMWAGLIWKRTTSK